MYDSWITVDLEDIPQAIVQVQNEALVRKQEASSSEEKEFFDSFLGENAFQRIKDLLENEVPAGVRQVSFRNKEEIE